MKTQQRANSKRQGAICKSSKVQEPPITVGEYPLVLKYEIIDWNFVNSFTPSQIVGHSLEDWAIKINGLFRLYHEGITSARDWMHCSARTAVLIGLYLRAAKNKIGHGRFGNWCHQNFPNASVKTLQRYMLVAKTTALSDLKPETTLKVLYMKLGILHTKTDTKRAKKVPHAWLSSHVRLADLIERLKSVREFIESCMEALPFEQYQKAEVDQLAAEISLLNATCDEFRKWEIAIKEPTPVKGVDLCRIGQTEMCATT